VKNYSKTRDIILLSACGVLCLMLASVVFIGIAAENKPGDSLTAQQILDKAATTYATCKSYRDSGVVTEDIGIGSKRIVTPIPFRTTFIRPDQFRFECGSLGPYIIWAKGSEVLKWEIKPGVQKLTSLEIGIAGATGVSGGSAHTIPALLLPDQIGGNKLSAMTDLMRLPDETVDGTSCFKLKGKFSDFKQPRTLWFEKATFLLRRIVEQLDLAKQTTDYRPEVDKDISAKELEFNAPKNQ
jgi:outer membrane lipoprotein-sorting protein